MTDSRKEDDKMNVLMINGSPNAKGCTFTALTEIGKTLQEQNIDYEIMQLGKQPIRDCINCNRCHGEGCIFDDDMVNEFIQKAKDADGFVFGTPVYYAHPSGRLLSFLDRAFYSSASSRIYKPFQFKPAAAIASARRAGTTASIDVINKYISIAMMPIVSSTYWNMVHGLTPEDVMQDKEGLQTMRNIGKNMAWMLQCIACAKQHNIPQPQPDVADSTNFIH